MISSRFSPHFRELDPHSGRIPLAALESWLESCPLDLEHLRPFLQFRTERYVRNLFHDGPAYQALVLCWRNGQRSPIHDHRGSSCGVKVLSGVASETTFERAGNGMIYPIGTRHLAAGAICASQDADIHQVSNLQAGGADLITLHVYSPPLLRMNMYSLDDGGVADFFDPVNDEFLYGSGI